ncbi:hypothetical protein MRX96_005316 [Rhipicephalus microplus]
MRLFTPPPETDTEQCRGALDWTSLESWPFAGWKRGVVLRFSCSEGLRSTTERNSALFWHEAGTEPHYPLLESDVVPAVSHAAREGTPPRLLALHYHTPRGRRTTEELPSDGLS